MALGAVRFSNMDEGPGFDPALVPIAEFLLGLRQHGITDRRLLTAFEAVPRRSFLPIEARHAGLYAERAQPIDCGQMTTPPAVMAQMIVALGPTERCRVLEIGTGTGYFTAVLAGLSRRVYTVDRFRTLVLAAQDRFEALRIANITSSFGDGTRGWPEKAPFDRILCSASAPTIPAAFAEQLRTGGVLVMPIGPEDGEQVLMRFEKLEGRLEGVPFAKVRMIPLIKGQAAIL